MPKIIPTRHSRSGSNTHKHRMVNNLRLQLLEIPGVGSVELFDRAITKQTTKNVKGSSVHSYYIGGEVPGHGNLTLYLRDDTIVSEDRWLVQRIRRNLDLDIFIQVDEMGMENWFANIGWAVNQDRTLGGWASDTKVTSEIRIDSDNAFKKPEVGGAIVTRLEITYDVPHGNFFNYR